MLGFLFNIVIALVGLALGGYILFFGRRALSATLGIVALVVGANILSVLVADGDRGRELIELQAWGLVGITVALGAIGVVLGRYKQDLAVDVIGFIAGANAALWLFEISSYLVTTVADLPENTVLWIGLGLLLFGGLLGIWLVRWDRDEALILLSVLVAVELIHDALGLNQTRVFTAILILGLALAGILVQYGIYLREKKSGPAFATPEPVASSLAYFQDLELG